jgi:methionine aminopeptidase
MCALVLVQTDQTTVDYSLANPDTLTKYKTAAQISHKVLETVTDWCAEGAKILTICEKGDKLLDEEVAKVYKGKKIAKGQPALCMQPPDRKSNSV